MKKLLISLVAVLGILTMYPSQAAFAASCRDLQVDPYGTGLRAYCFSGGTGYVRITVYCASGYWPYYGTLHGAWVKASNGFLAATDTKLSSNASCGYGGGLVYVNGKTHIVDYRN